MKRWDYLFICPDNPKGYEAIVEAGQDGWKAACSWTDLVYGGVGTLPWHRNHILFKRPVEEPPKQSMGPR